MEEYWDIYDKDRVFQHRTIRRGEPFKEGEYYVCCEVWLQNSKGEMLITQRHPKKKAGGLWEFIGGGVLAGETTVQAAVREVKEEIGLVLSKNDLKLLHVYQNGNYFMDIYIVNKDVNTGSLVLGENETVDAKWVSREELRLMIEKQKVVHSVAQRFNMLSEIL
ncbi:MAG: NUDIX domain-containing protein [Clostridiales bacterium]|nr:NUDIX domain-containing protein [Clostridiales bacterium]